MDSAAPNPGSLAPLLDQHRVLIEASAIDPVVAAERGYRSITRPEELRHLGFGASQLRVPALLVPVHDVQGKVASHQSRPDTPRTDARGRSIKYETPTGSRMVLDLPPRARPWIADPQRELWITEGARKADCAVSLGVCAVALLGVWNWRGRNPQDGLTVLADWEQVALNDRTAFLAFDSDAMSKLPVFKALRRFRAWLQSRGAAVKVVYLPNGPDGAKVGLDDYVAGGHGLDDLRSLASDELREPDAAFGSSAPRSRLILQPMSEVEPQPVRWLWQGMIPFGKLTILAGHGSVGKSTIALDIAARVTRGEPLPDGSPAPEGTVMVLAAEDDAADTVRPRLDAAGADASRVHLVGSMIVGEVERPFRLPDDLPALREALAEHRQTRLLIVDTLSDVLPAVDENSNSEVRAALIPLAKLAADAGIAVLLIMHLRKANGVSAQHRLHGSIAFGAVARTVLQVCKVAGHRGEAFLTKSKSNLAAMTGESYRFRIDGEPPRTEWLGIEAVDADDAMQQADEPHLATSGARRSAEDFLRRELAGGPKLVGEVRDAAAAEGISERTLRRACRHMRVESRPSGSGKPWLLRLATSETDRNSPETNGHGQVGQHEPDEAGDGDEAVVSQPILSNMANSDERPEPASAPQLHLDSTECEPLQADSEPRGSETPPPARVLPATLAGG